MGLSNKDIDLSFSVRRRTFGACNGKYNFPDGEIATNPVDDSANGWVRFSYLAVHSGKDVEDIELRFNDGRIVKKMAGKGRELLPTLPDTDQGSRYPGEWGPGTNYQIQRFTKNMLFGEKNRRHHPPGSRGKTA